MTSRYVIGLGSNRRHQRFGGPEAVLKAALNALRDIGAEIERVSPIIATRPHGPSLRRYANAVAVVSAGLAPDELLLQLKRIERQFGRRRGRRWGARVLDLDIILWSGGAWSSAGLRVPHVAFRHRDFVLRPALTVAPKWRDPLSGLTVRQLANRRYKG